MAKQHIFTQREDRIIIKNVKNNPQNIKAALNKSADELYLTFNQVYWRYYKHLRKNNKIFVLVSEKKKGETNAKICKTTKKVLPKWKLIIKQLLDL